MKKKVLIGSLIGCLVLLPFAGIGVVLAPCIFGVLDALWEDSKNYPGKELFWKESGKIDVDTGKIAFGNSNQALAVATEFSLSVEAVADAFSTGQNGQAPPSAGHFLTYCRIGPKGVVILCHVPDSRGYNGRELTMFETTAWTLAQSAATKAGVDPHLPLVVGLRTFGTYGTVMIGKITGDPASRTEELDGRPRLYPYFIDSTPGD
jgi:hypothetical protein